MELKIDVKIEAKDMYDFFLYHTYSSIKGYIGIILGIGVFILFFATLGEVSDTYSVIYVICGILFLFYQPLNLYTKAKRQVLLTPMFKKPISYNFDQEGILVKQDDTENKIYWKDIYKVRESKKALFIYGTNATAFIFPKRLLGSIYNDLKKQIGSADELKNVKLK